MSLGPVASVFMNMQVKCSIFSAKVDEHFESNLIDSNDWLN